MSNEDTTTSLDTATMVEIERIQTILDDREVRGQLIGAIIKIPTEVLLDDEVVAGHLTQEHVFGSVYNIADVCEHTGDRALEVNWSIDPHFFSLAGNDFGGMVPVWEHEVLPVLFRTDEDDGSEELVTGYFEMINGKWETTEKRVPLCEYCTRNTCDRMTYGSELDTEIERLLTTDLEVRAQRYNMYRYYTLLKHGRLGQGNRRRVQECVQQLIHERFPLTFGFGPVGFLID